MGSDAGIATDLLNIDSIRRALSSEIVGHRICLLWDVSSTNDALRGMAVAGAPSGTAVLAESQHAGRGRGGKRWFSPPRLNLYASVLLRPEIPLSSVPVFRLLAPLGVSDAIRIEGLFAAIKWPNDVVVGRQKVAGTLVECSTHDGDVQHVILGIGVNLNVGREALRAALGDAAGGATSLREMTGREIDRNVFAGTLLTCLDRWFRTYATEGAAPVLAAWRDRDILTGRRIEIRSGLDTWDGRARGLDRDGFLVVEDALGHARQVVDGEIRVLD